MCCKQKKKRLTIFAKLLQRRHDRRLIHFSTCDIHTKVEAAVGICFSFEKGQQNVNLTEVWGDVNGKGFWMDAAISVNQNVSRFTSDTALERRRIGRRCRWCRREETRVCTFGRLMQNGPCSLFVNRSVECLQNVKQTQAIIFVQFARRRIGFRHSLHLGHDSHSMSSPPVKNPKWVKQLKDPCVLTDRRDTCRNNRTTGQVNVR